MRDIEGLTDITQTDFGYTGQRAYESFGLSDYNARFYSSSLGRFTQPDSIIPGATNSQSWNRFSYVINNPIKYNDPTGHMYAECFEGEGCGEFSIKDYNSYQSSDGENSEYFSAPRVGLLEGGKQPGIIEDDINPDDEIVYEWHGCMPECEKEQIISNNVGNMTQDISTTLSGIGTVLELGMGALGCSIGAFIGCVAGYNVGTVIYNVSPLNFFEAGFGFFSAIFGAGSDVLSGETNFTLTQTGVSGQIGGGTRASVLTQGIGAASPYATADFVLDVISSVYNRNDSKNPTQFNFNW